MEWALTILVFFGVIAVTALIFIVWIVAMVLRLVFGGIVSLFTWPDESSAVWPPGELVCPNPYCRAVHPAQARYCRRCGRQLQQAQRVRVRRAAAW